MKGRGKMEGEGEKGRCGEGVRGKRGEGRWWGEGGWGRVYVNGPCAGSRQEEEGRHDKACRIITKF